MQHRLTEGEGSIALGNEFRLGVPAIRAIQKCADKINEPNNYATNESAKRGFYSRNIVIEKRKMHSYFGFKNQLKNESP